MEYDPALYGDRIADIYDEELALLPEHFDPGDCVAFLAEIVEDGEALELGVGTGRVAIPLASTGARVTGIDASEAMLDRLRAKDPMGAVGVVLGDFSELGSHFEGRTFHLVYAVANTFAQIRTREQQRACLDDARRFMTSDGTLVIDAWVPNPTRFTANQYIGIWRVTVDEVVLEVSRYNPFERTILMQQVIIRNRSVRVNPSIQLETYPDELDKLAEVAGFALSERLGGWRGEPFGPGLSRHISVYKCR